MLKYRKRGMTEKENIIFFSWIKVLTVSANKDKKSALFTDLLFSGMKMLSDHDPAKMNVNEYPDLDF